MPVRRHHGDYAEAAAGIEAVTAAYNQALDAKRPRRHIIANSLVTSWSDAEATVSNDLLVVENAEAGWAITMVSRYDDILRRANGD